jgi:catechol 2,3-dioxygenase-like lactoylglutathione lyase family enzyme
VAPEAGCENGAMLDHVAIQCTDVAASASFYDAVFAPLGGRRVMDFGEVRAFCDAARGLGAEVLHEPRVWPEYHENYYGAFVRDPDGNNVEAVCHLPG